MSETILIVEDERAIVDAVAYLLEKEGFRVIASFDGAEGLRLARAERPDLVILDITLPGLNGFEFCRAVRRVSDLPIVMLTARAEEVDRVVGLEMGADDYITKPFSLKELVARVRAILRRTGVGQGTEMHAFRSGDIEIDPAGRVAARAGMTIPLTLKEYGLLRILVAARGCVLPRSTLLDAVWGPHECGDERTLDVHVSRLRQKIEDDPGHPCRIVTVRGVGYKFVG